MRVAAAFRGMSAVRVPAGRGIPLLADIPDGERRDSRAQRRRSRQSSVSISSSKILVTAATALGRSLSTPRNCFGREITHCRTGTGGIT